jgi:hypothetical protein
METGWKPILRSCDFEIPPGRGTIDLYQNRHRHHCRFGQPGFDEAIRPCLSRRSAEMSGGNCLKH